MARERGRRAGGADGDDSALNRILDETSELLAANGEEALRLNDVAKRARVSLTTVYAHFPSRDELLLAAVRRWMHENIFRTMPAPENGDTFDRYIIRCFRHVFGPWADNPTMLTVFIRASLLPGGDRMTDDGNAALAQAADLIQPYDPEWFADVAMILEHLTDGLLRKFASGDLDVPAITARFERTVAVLFASQPDGGAHTSGDSGALN